MTAQTTLTAVIPASGSVSPAVAFNYPGLTAIVLKDNWTAALVSLLVSLDGGATYVPLYRDGAQFAEPGTVGQYINLDPTLFSGVTNLKVQSGTSANPVAQPLAATVDLIGFFSVQSFPAPNERRTFAPMYDGDVGTFTGYTPSEQDSLTFDFTNLLDPNETIVSVGGVTLAASADSTSSSRVIGSPVTSGSTVTQLLGNWQAIRYINYLATCTVTTSENATLTAQGYFPVQDRTPCC